MKLMKNFSKICVTLIVATLLLSSVSVMAFDLGYVTGDDVVTNLPTVADIEAVKPTFTITPTKATSKADVEAAGISSKTSKNYINDLWDTYIIDINVTGLNDLAVGWDSTDYNYKQGLTLSAVKLTFGDAPAEATWHQMTWGTTTMEAKSLGYQDTKTLNLIIGEAQKTGMIGTYPGFTGDDGSSIANPVINGKLVVCVDKDSYISFDTTSLSAIYSITKDAVSNTAVAVPDDQAISLTLGTAAVTTKTVTYATGYDGGTAPAAAQVAPSTAFNVAAGIERDGYTFLGWNDGTTTYAAGAEHPGIAADTTLTAVWGATVTFDSQEGSEVAPAIVEVGKTVVAPDDPTRTGYTFKHWATEANGETAFDFTTTISAATTLYAVWEQIPAGPTTETATAVKAPTYGVLAGKDYFYNNVWSATYTFTVPEGKTATKAYVKFDGRDKEYGDTISVAGPGSVEFGIAILGFDTDVAVTDGVGYVTIQ